VTVNSDSLTLPLAVLLSRPVFAQLAIARLALAGYPPTQQGQIDLQAN